MTPCNSNTQPSKKNTAVFYISMYALSLLPLIAKTEPGCVNRMKVCCTGRVRQDSG